MTTMYKTGDWSSELIEKVEAEKATDKSVWINGNRSARFSTYAQFHETWKEAHVYLMEKAEAKLNIARRSLEQAQGYHGNVKGLKEF